MDNIIDLIAETLNEANEPENPDAWSKSSGKTRGIYGSGSETKGGEDLPQSVKHGGGSLGQTWTSQDPNVVGSGIPSGKNVLDTDPHYVQGKSRHEDWKKARSTRIEDSHDEENYETAKRSVWKLFDVELDKLEKLAKAGEGQLREKNITASELPNFADLADLCHRKIWVDLRYPRILDEATRKSPRKWVLLGWGDLRPDGSSKVDRLNKTARHLGTTLRQIRGWPASVFMQKFVRDPDKLGDFLQNFETDREQTFTLNDISSGRLSPTQLADELSQQYTMYEDIKLSGMAEVDRILIHATGGNVEIESLHEIPGNPIIDVGLTIPAGTSSGIINVSDSPQYLPKIGISYKLTDRTSRVQIYGLTSESDEDSSVYLKRLLKSRKIKSYRIGANADKLLLPGNWSGNNTTKRLASDGITPLDDAVNNPRMATAEADSLMRRLAALKISVVGVKDGGSALRDWIGHKFNKRFPDFATFKEDKTKLRFRQERWVQRANQTTDYTMDSNLTLPDIRRNILDWSKLVRKKINNIKLPETAKRLKPYLDDPEKEIDIYNVKISGEKGKEEYCTEIEKILNDHNDKLGEINSLFKIHGLMNIQPDNDNLIDIGLRVQRWSVDYARKFTSKLREIAQPVIAGGARVGNREIPKLLTTNYLVEIDENGIPGDPEFDIQQSGVERVGPIRAAKKVRYWNPLVERGNEGDRCVLRFDVGGDTFHVGTTLGEVYSRGFVEKSSFSHGNFRSNTALQNVKVLPTDGTELELISSAKRLQPFAHKYARINNVDIKELIAQINSVDESEPDSERTDQSLGELNQVLRLIKDKLGLALNIDIFKVSERERLGKKSKSNLKHRKRNAKKCIKKAVLTYAKKYKNADSEEAGLEGWRPGFYITSGFTLKFLAGGGKAPVTSGVTCGKFYWDRTITDTSEGTHKPIGDMGGEKAVVSSYPVFQQAWLPSADDLSEVIKTLKGRLVGETGPSERPASPEAERHFGAGSGEAGLTRRGKLQQRLEQLELALSELESVKAPNVPNAIKSPYQWPKYTDPDQELTITYGDAACVCGHQESSHEDADDCEECECDKFDAGRTEKYQERISVRDFYEKDAAERFGAQIEDSNDSQDPEDAVVSEKIVAYTSPIHDNTSTGARCELCSAHDSEDVFHAKFTSLGNTPYKQDESWDPAASERGYDPGQLVRLVYEYHPDDDDREVTEEVVLRRHEIAERKLMEDIEPPPSIHPAAAPELYAQLAAASAELEKLRDADSTKRIKNYIASIAGDIKSAKNSVFAFIPAHGERKAKVITLSAEAQGDNPSQYEEWLDDQRRWAQNPEAEDWQKEIKIPGEVGDSIDTNGADAEIAKKDHYFNPQYPGGSSQSDSEMRPYNKADELDVFEDIANAIPTGKTTNPTLMDPNDVRTSAEAAGRLAPWIAHDRLGDNYYLVMPPVNQKFIDQMGTNKRGEEKGGKCYHCERPTGFLLIYSKKKSGGHWVDVPYVRPNKEEPVDFTLPLTAALKQLKELWISHRWSQKSVRFPEINLQVGIDESIDGFKTFEPTQQSLMSKKNEQPVSQLMEIVMRKHKQAQRPMVGKCQNKIVDKRTDQERICGQDAYIRMDPKVVYPVLSGGTKKWRVGSPAAAEISMEMQEIEDHTGGAYQKAQEDYETALADQKDSPERTTLYCQSCFISGFDLFPDYITKEMNTDLGQVLIYARQTWVKAQELEQTELISRKMKLSKLLEDFTIKWFSDKSFWTTWEDYINRDVGLKGVQRQGATLPNYLIKNLLRARYRAMLHLEDIASNPGTYLNRILLADENTGKPAYVAKLETLQGTIAGWHIFNNNFKLKGYERSIVQSGDTGMIHTVNLWRVMTRAEKNRSAYDESQNPNPQSVQQAREAKRGKPRKTVRDDKNRDRDLVIIDGITGKDAFLNGLAGFVESSSPNGTLIVELNENTVVNDRRIKLFKGEYILFDKTNEMPVVTFEDKHKVLVLEEDRKRLENLGVINLIGEFTSDSLYW